MTDDNKEIPIGEDEATPDPSTAPTEDTLTAEEPTPQEQEPPEDAETAVQVEESQPESPEQNEDSEAQADESPVEPLDTPEESEDSTPGEDRGMVQTEETQTPGEEIVEPTEESPTIGSVLEAILFATDEPLPESKLAGIVETTAKQVRESIESLNARYEAHHHAFRIDQIAGGYQMLTQPLYNSWLKKMVRVRGDNKLSPAAMETLAIIAYKQPIIRADIEAIRGVAVGEVIRSLMYKGLVKITGRAEILGRPMLYGTTKKFLEVFGLNSLKDLPKAEDLKNPDRA